MLKTSFWYGSIGFPYMGIALYGDLDLRTYRDIRIFRFYMKENHEYSLKIMVYEGV